MSTMLQQMQPRSSGARIAVFIAMFAAGAMTLYFIDQLAPLVRNGFGEPSWILLASVRVLGVHVALLAAWRRIVYPQHRNWVTVGLVLYALGAMLSLAFDTGLNSPLRLHQAFMHVGMITLSIGLIRVRSDS